MTKCSNILCKKENESKFKLCQHCRDIKKKSRIKRRVERLSEKVDTNKKTCNKCLRILNLTFFINKNKKECTKCHVCREKDKNFASKKRIQKLNSTNNDENKKKCGSCLYFFNLDQFSNNSEQCNKCKQQKLAYYYKKKNEICELKENDKKCSSCLIIKNIIEFKTITYKTCNKCLKNKEEIRKKHMCKICKLFQVISSPYKPYCFICYCFLHPEAEISQKRFFKQNTIKENIMTKYPNEKIIFDKIINNGCSKRRPDFFIDKFTHSIIIECDENQHKYENEICENKRMMEIFQDLGNRPIIFIRFNPDKYKNKNNKIKGCFYQYRNKYKIKEEELNKRLKVLFDTINLNLNNIPKKEVTINNLFFDVI